MGAENKPMNIKATATAANAMFLTSVPFPNDTKQASARLATARR